MTEIPVIGFAGYSGSGKTTLIEKLIPVLKEKGLRLAVIKHDGHRFEIDQEGKDSWRFAKAGADIILLNSEEKTACTVQENLSLEQMLGMVHDVDLILVEGYKDKDLPQIGIAREETGKGFTANADRFLAVITDMKVHTSNPCFGLDDIQEIAAFIWEKAKGIGGISHTGGQLHKKKIPSMDEWLREAKADPSASKIGMYLTHNGVVRGTARAMVREGDGNARPVAGRSLSFEQSKVEAAIAATYRLPGIYYIRTWLNEGELQVGEDMMYVLVGGDIRPHVVEALEFLVGELKSECVAETERFH